MPGGLPRCRWAPRGPPVIRPKDYTTAFFKMQVEFPCFSPFSHRIISLPVGLRPPDLHLREVPGEELHQRWAHYILCGKMARVHQIDAQGLCFQVLVVLHVGSDESVTPRRRASESWEARRRPPPPPGAPAGPSPRNGRCRRRAFPCKGGKFSGGTRPEGPSQPGRCRRAAPVRQSRPGRAVPHRPAPGPGPDSH